ncbi:DUF222 domain-containing protein [Bdellovibrio bacteriovorus]|uniref:DUF222 domain-containing protein n=1 Tax=Bdellovibrio bacteriovorus TaxID=959 RepID=UPI0035A72FA6
MKIQFLSNEELEQNLKSLVKQERELLSVILEHIQEVERRKLYLKMAYPSLFEYLTKNLGYSAGSAQRRIDAARLSKEIPELSAALETGALNLSQVSLVQKALRQNKKEAKISINTDEKRELLNHLAGKSFEESQVLVAQAFNMEVLTASKVQHQADASVRLELSFTRTQWEKLEQMRMLL